MTRPDLDRGRAEPSRSAPVRSVLGRSVLVLGGTRFFGRRLVELHAARGARVVVATRGQRDVPQHPSIEFVRAERKSSSDLQLVLQRGPFDVIHDQIGFQPRDLSTLIAAIENRCESPPRLVFTSSGAVYPPRGDGRARTLDEFDPDGVGVAHVDPAHLDGARDDLDYGEGKRACEAIAMRSNVPTAILRIPVVVGPDDPTGRLDAVVQTALARGVVEVSDPGRTLSLVSSADAARALEWLASADFEGARNVVSGRFGVDEFAELLASAAGRSIDLRTALEPDPFAIVESSDLDDAQSRKDGFSPDPGFRAALEEWVGAAVGRVKGDAS